MAKVVGKKKHQQLDTLVIHQLKGIKNLTIRFSDKHVIGIFGANCVGKSTILHALACMYQPELGLMNENYKFSQFFKTDSFQNWRGSKLSIEYSYKQKDNDPIEQKIYNIHKRGDRWNKDYGRRPARDVYFIGIETCIPQIEREHNDSQTIKLEPKEFAINKSEKIIKNMSGIFNKDYRNLFEKKKLVGRDKYAAAKCVEDEQEFTYTSLTMGAGEQRVIRILQALHSLPTNSLLLIDEIDLTLHTPALIKLVQIIQSVAEERNLQVIFTSHREELLDIPNISIRFISKDVDGNMQCFENINSDCINALRVKPKRSLKIYCEDKLAESIINNLLIELGIRKKAEIKIIGSCNNAFSLIVGKFHDETLDDNTIAILDGDRYTTKEQQLDYLKNVLTGNEPCREQQRKNLLKYFISFDLQGEQQLTPDEWIHKSLIESDLKTEIINIAKSIHGVQDKHDFLDSIIEELGCSKELGYAQIINEYKRSNPIKWAKHVAPIRKWIEDRKDV